MTELLTLALPLITTAVMFGFKWLAGLKAFENGAQAKPWLRVLLIGTSLVGTFAVAVLNGQEIDAGRVSDDLWAIMMTLGTAYLSHTVYKAAK